MKDIVIDGEVNLDQLIDGETDLSSQVEGEMMQVLRYTSDDYERLAHKPSIESVTLIGDKSFEDLGLSSIPADELINILR